MSKKDVTHRRAMQRREQLQMLLHPDRYTDGQLDEMLNDTDIPVPDIDTEWQRFMESADNSLFTLHSSLKKIAAAFIGLLMLSGITYAAIHIATTRTAEKEIVANRKPDQSKAKNVKTIGYDLPVTPSKASPIIFEDRELQEIMQYIAKAYSVKFTFKDEAKARLRFYLQWEKDDTLQDIIDKINHFKKVHLTLTDETITID